MNTYEWIGFTTSLLYVYSNIHRNIWAWFWAIVGATMYCIVFWQTKLYADACLQIAFIILSLYGFWQWKIHKNLTNAFVIRHLTIKNYVSSLLSLMFLWCAITYILIYHTDSNTPYLDALTTSLSLIAQWQTAKRYIESWLLWILTDVLYVLLYTYKALYLTTALYALFLVLAWIGYKQWRIQAKRERKSLLIK